MLAYLEPVVDVHPRSQGGRHEVPENNKQTNKQTDKQKNKGYHTGDRVGVIL